MTARPVHLPSCRCGGSGLIRSQVHHASNGTGPGRTYTEHNPCAHSRPPTGDEWAAWQAGRIAGGRMTISSEGLVDRDQAAERIAAARAALNQQPHQGESP